MKEEFKVGDEIMWAGNVMRRGIVTNVYIDEDDDELDTLYVLSPNDDCTVFNNELVPIWLATKTGRHFDGFDELVNFFKTDGEDEIIPGDEVAYGDGPRDKGIVYRIVDGFTSLIGINSHGHVRTDYVYVKDCVKTGRHYYQFEELMSNFDEIAIFLSKKED